MQKYMEGGALSEKGFMAFLAFLPKEFSMSMIEGQVVLDSKRYRSYN